MAKETTCGLPRAYARHSGLLDHIRVNRISWNETGFGGLLLTCCMVCILPARSYIT